LRDTKPENKKLVKSGRVLGHVTYFSNFGTPNIFGTAEDTNLKFCMKTDLEGYYTKKLKNWSKMAVA